MLEPPSREVVLAAVDEGGDAVRLSRSGTAYVPEPLAYEDVLSLILQTGGESLRCVVAHHVGELRLVSLRPRLEELLESRAGFFLSRVVENALAAFREEDLRRA